MKPKVRSEKTIELPIAQKRDDLRVISTLDDATWDAFVTSSADGHLLQTSAWGTLKARFGWGMDRLALIQHDNIVAGAQILYRSFPSSAFTLAYVPMGPLVDWQDGRVTQPLLRGLREMAERRHAFCLRLEPGLIEDQQQARTPASYGLRPSEQNFQPRRTIILDLEGDEGDILARMHSKTRYNIRLAERKGILIREGGREDLQVFQNMLADTTERDGFHGHNIAYYRAIYDLFVPSGQAQFLLATYQGIPLAGVIAFITGRRAWYMYGASSNQHRNRMPNYLLQWEAIKWAKSRACLTYDLWGVPDEEDQVLEAEFPERDDGLWGVYRFKRGFGGRTVRLVGTFDQVCSRPKYWAYEKGSALLERLFGETWHRRLRSG